jgi:hypothetical protein
MSSMSLPRALPRNAARFRSKVQQCRRAPAAPARGASAAPAPRTRAAQVTADRAPSHACKATRRASVKGKSTLWFLSRTRLATLCS